MLRRGESVGRGRSEGIYGSGSLGYLVVGTYYLYSRESRTLGRPLQEVVDCTEEQQCVEDERRNKRRVPYIYYPSFFLLSTEPRHSSAYFLS